jgi:hypothetical protein
MVFFRRKKKKRRPREEISKELNVKILNLKEKLTDKLNNFLVTRHKELGKLGEGNDWTLYKNGETLFKLEGSDYTILFNTGSFLTKRKGKLLGMLEINEIDLCRLLANPKSKKFDFVKKSKTSNLSYRTKIFYKEFLGLQDQRNTDLQTLESRIIKWPQTLAFLYIAKTPINLIAHSILQFDQKYTNWLLNNVSNNYKRMLLEELEFLGSRSFLPDSGFSKIKSLLEFEDALLHLEDVTVYLEKYYL